MKVYRGPSNSPIRIAIKAACRKFDRLNCKHMARQGTEKGNTKTEISQGIGHEINLMRSAGLKTSIRVFIVMATRAIIQLSVCEPGVCARIHSRTSITYDRGTSPLFVILLYLPCLFLSENAKNAFSRFH